MDTKEAGSSLDSLISSFNTRIAELQELVIGRNSESNTNLLFLPSSLFLSLHFDFLLHASEISSQHRLAVYPASSISDLSAVDTAVKAMELQVQAIKDRLREETEAIPKAKVLYLH